MAPKLVKLERETMGLKLFPILTLMGWAIILFGILVQVLVLSPTAAAYWGENAKATRDLAEAGTALVGQLTTLSWWPKLLLPVIFFGVASFMLGIALQFAAIPAILDRRIEGLKKALPLMGRK